MDNKIQDLNYDDFTTEQIYILIREGVVTNQEVVDFYNNDGWDEIP